MRAKPGFNSLAAILEVVRLSKAKSATLDLVLMNCPVPTATKIYNSARDRVLEMGNFKKHSLTVFELPESKCFLLQTVLAGMPVTVTVGVTDQEFWRAAR